MPYPRHTAGLTSHFNTLIFSQEHVHLHWTLTGVKMNGRQTLLVYLIATASISAFPDPPVSLLRKYFRASDWEQTEVSVLCQRSREGAAELHGEVCWFSSHLGVVSPRPRKWKHTEVIWALSRVPAWKAQQTAALKLGFSSVIQTGDFTSVYPTDFHFMLPTLALLWLLTGHVKCWYYLITSYATILN